MSAGSVVAVVMAGGKGKRFALAKEKPLLCVAGKPVVDYVLSALKNANYVSDVVVAVSAFTPKTAAYLEGLGVKVLWTPGKEYVSDMGYAVKALRLREVLTVSADLPLLTSEIVDDVVVRYFSCRKPALAVAVPFELRERLGLGEGYTFDFNGERVVFAGINVNDGSRIDDAELEQEVYVLNQIEVALNINTVEELRIAETQFAQLHRAERMSTSKRT